MTRQRRSSLLILTLAGAAVSGLQAGPPASLLDRAPWEKHRGSVRHPCLVVKPADAARARANIARHAWAKNYAAGVEKAAARDLALLTPAFVERMIGETTPGDPLWTPCPSCRARGKPLHPHGLWSWSVADAEHIRCKMCGVAFPNDEYPEDVVVRTRWRAPQTISYCGGEPFVIFGYRTGRPSFTANVRARKVAWMAGCCRTLAEAHLLTGRPEFARACRDILVRFARCYPGWLVHVGYGEYADMDPRVAAASIRSLPEPELCPPPNVPDRRLHTGYWSAGRAGGVGMESGFVRKVLEAYDFTCDARDAGGEAIYREADRRAIERDLLLESTVLLVSDDAINNKSVSNRTAAALVGMCLGHPELVRFGLDGFRRTVDGWFLKDGATSESPGYGTMTLGGIWDFAQAMLGYSDPPGYRDGAGERIDSLDLYRDAAYGRVWEAFFNGLQGNLSYPPCADSNIGSGLGANFIELMAANYPDRPHYLALLAETAAGGRAAPSGGDSTRRDLLKEIGGAGISLYVRDPALDASSAPRLVLPDWCPPDLRIGHMRTGADGRESLLTLGASHWGNHHHLDSLNLYYWKSGRELLSDLGYLWDHPQSVMTRRTVAHNTVLIDGADQVTKERGGDVLLFETSERVKVMEVSSCAYPRAPLYRRTAALVDHGNGRSYAVDLFRVEGGARQDYVYHGADAACAVTSLTLEPAGTEALYDFANVRRGDGARVWRASWACGGGVTCVAWNVGQPGERAFLADGWGQRDWKNSDIGATLPYVVRRREGGGPGTFVSVFEGHGAEGPFVRGVRLLDPAGTLEIDTALGMDRITSTMEPAALPASAAPGPRRAGSRFAVVSMRGDAVAWTFAAPAEGAR